MAIRIIHVTAGTNWFTSIGLAPGDYAYDDITHSYHALAAPTPTASGKPLTTAELAQLSVPDGYTVGPIPLAQGVVLTQSYTIANGWWNYIYALGDLIFSSPAAAVQTFTPAPVRVAPNDPGFLAHL